MKAGKPYALQVYPGQLHGFRAKEDRIARDRALLAHFERTLTPGRPSGASARSGHHLQLAAEGRLEAGAQAAHAPRR